MTTPCPTRRARRCFNPRPLPLLAGLLLVTALSAVTTGCGDSRSAGGPPSWAMQRPPASVTTAPVQQGSFTVDAHFVGVLKATSTADLYARTSGQIVEVHADSGDKVRAGQLLARIEPDEAEKAVQQAKAALRIAEATLSQRQANLQIAQATARRTQTLFAQDLVAQQDEDSAQADLVGAKAQLELAKAQIAQAQANLSGARLELQKTRVVAPFDGWVGKRYLDLGDFASTNRPVFSVVDLSTIKTTISITEKDAGRIDRGQPATLRTEAFPDRVFEGQVARIASVFDPETNTTDAEVEIANPEATLKPGMFADVSVTYKTEPTALLVPTSAVVETENEHFVYIVERAAESDGPLAAAAPASGGPPASGGEDSPGAGAGPRWIAHKVPVRVLGTGTSARDLSAIEVQTQLEGRAASTGGTGATGATAALDPGAHVIVLGQEGLADGAPVAITEASGTAAPRNFEDGGKRS